MLPVHGDKIIAKKPTIVNKLDQDHTRAGLRLVNVLRSQMSRGPADKTTLSTNF